jgi:16S rRNA (uracil1498-N3)-methyltransferase
MSYFLSGQNLELDKQLEITGEEARHILLARRIKVGEHIALQGPDEKRFEAEVISFTKKNLIVKVLKEETAPKEPILKISLFQAVVAEQALDSILQKSTELGVVQIFLFNSKNTPAHVAEKLEKKLERWNRIALEAAKQSDRIRPPQIVFLTDWKSVLLQTKALDKVFLLEKTAKKSFRDFASEKYQKTGLLVGPEGGFTEEEIREFSKLKNVAPVRMGPRILRADTAAIASISIAQTLFGDLK